MDINASTPGPAGPAVTPVVYKPRDVFVFRAIASAIALMVVCAPFAVVVVVAGAVPGILVFVVIYVVLALVIWLGLRRRVSITPEELVVQGLLSRVRVPLASLRAVHYTKTGRRADRHRLVLWVAADGIRPFRTDLMAGRPDFLDELRQRAVASGARLDRDADELAEAPPNTRLLF